MIYLTNPTHRRRNANAPVKGRCMRVALPLPGCTGVRSTALEAFLPRRGQLSNTSLACRPTHESQERSLAADRHKAGVGGLRSSGKTIQALSRPDTLAHDSRKASLGNAEYPAARLLLDRSWGKGRDCGLGAKKRMPF